MNTKRTIPNILLIFTQLLGSKMVDNTLQIPEKFGNGYCSGFILNEYIHLMISNYELKENIEVKNSLSIDRSKKSLFFKFKNIFAKSEQKQLTNIPSVLVSTSRINTDEIIFIHTNTETINIEVDTTYLENLFGLPNTSSVLKGLLENSQPLLFEEIIDTKIQKIISEIVTRTIDKTFEFLFLRIKVEELICYLLMELERRDEQKLYALNNNDIQAIYKIKEQVLKHLGVSPRISDLAEEANMSPSKLKKVFKQVFGSSIFNYYQTFRMREAAYLLIEEKWSVSEVGYELGFTNLSHFSRVFKTHNDMNSRQFNRSY